MEALNQEVMELQQLWLRQQSELVRLSQQRDAETQELISCKRQLTILSQKKIRTESKCFEDMLFHRFNNNNDKYLLYRYEEAFYT